MKNSYTAIRWVQYPCLIAGVEVWRFGFFYVDFIEDKPAFARPVGRIMGRKGTTTDFLKIHQEVQIACQRPILQCSNVVDLDNPPIWDGNLVFDHLPVLG